MTTDAEKAFERDPKRMRAVDRASDRLRDHADAMRAQARTLNERADDIDMLRRSLSATRSTASTHYENSQKYEALVKRAKELDTDAP